LTGSWKTNNQIQTQSNSSEEFIWKQQHNCDFVFIYLNVGGIMFQKWSRKCFDIECHPPKMLAKLPLWASKICSDSPPLLLPLVSLSVAFHFFTFLRNWSLIACQLPYQPRFFSPPTIIPLCYVLSPTSTTHSTNLIILNLHF
jgi:hypothetical protein